MGLPDILSDLILFVLTVLFVCGLVVYLTPLRILVRIRRRLLKLTGA